MLCARKRIDTMRSIESRFIGAPNQIVRRSNRLSATNFFVNSKNKMLSLVRIEPQWLLALMRTTCGQTHRKLNTHARTLSRWWFHSYMRIAENCFYCCVFSPSSIARQTIKPHKNESELTNDAVTINEEHMRLQIHILLVTSSSSGYLFHTFARNQIRCTWTNRNFRRNRFEIWTLSLILHSINVLFPRNSAECYFAPEHKQVYGLTPSQRLNRRIIIIIVSGPRFCFNAASCTIASTEWVRRHIQCEFIVAVVFVLLLLARIVCGDEMKM